MFHPLDQPMERGWVGRVENDRVVQLAAQTLQSFFTGGGSAREHAVYPLAEVRLLAPVLHPPAVRLFDDDESFEFANPAAIVGPGAVIQSPSGGSQWLRVLSRLAAVVATEGRIGGYTVLAEWRSPELRRPKDRDFALGLGPLVVTPDELDLQELVASVRLDDEEELEADLDGFDLERARTLASEGTRLFPGDLIASAPLGVVPVPQETAVAIELSGIGTLSASTGA